MDVATFCRESRVLLVVGKGGVGKTTVCAALARAAEAAGLEVLLVALDDSSGLRRLLGSREPLTDDEVRLGPRIRARTITADTALLAYLADHGLARVSRRLISSGMIEVVSTAIPGIREVLVLGRVKQLERDRAADLLILDAPATGHAVTFLTSPGGLLGAARGGPLRSQAAEVVSMLQDPARCQVALVTIPEETPVNEVVEAAFRLEDEVGVSLGPLVVNCCYPPAAGLDEDPLQAALAAGRPAPSPELAGALRDAARFRRSRFALQKTQLERLAEEVPLAQVHLPYLFSATIGEPEVQSLATALAEAIAGLPEASKQAPSDGMPTGEGEPASAEAPRRKAAGAAPG